MNANGILDGLTCAGAVDEGGIHVVNRSFTVTAQCQTVGHVASTVFAKVEGVLPLVWMFWVAVWYDHLGQR